MPVASMNALILWLLDMESWGIPGNTEACPKCKSEGLRLCSYELFQLNAVLGLDTNLQRCYVLSVAECTLLATLEGKTQKTKGCDS